MNPCFLALIPISKLTIMAVFAAGAGVYFVYQGARAVLRRRALAHVPAAYIRNAAIGPVAVSGMATGPNTLTAPLSGKPCFLYQTTVWQLSGNRKSDLWLKAAEETLHLPFFVEDSTGKLLVEPLGAELDVRREFRAEYGMPVSPLNEQEIPPRVSVFVARHGVPPGRPIRVEEHVVEPETPVFIAGTVTENPGIRLRPPAETPVLQPRTSRSPVQDSPVPVRMPEVIRLSSGSPPTATDGMTQQQKIAAALSRAGITKPEAWAAAGVPRSPASPENIPDSRFPATNVALQDAQQVQGSAADESSLAADSRQDGCPKAGTDSDVAPPLVLMKDASNPTFIISCHSQQEVVGSLGWKSVAMMIGGASLAVLGVYVLLLEWHPL